MSMADFPNWLLTRFSTVAEVRAAVEAGEAIVAPTLLKGWPPEPQPFHYVVYDKSGASIAIEPLGGKLKVFDNPLGVMTNSPSFDWHMTNLRNYIALNPRNVPPVTISGATFRQLGQGSGMLGLPGDFSPPSPTGSKYRQNTLAGSRICAPASVFQFVSSPFRPCRPFRRPASPERRSWAARRPSPRW